MRRFAVLLSMVVLAGALSGCGGTVFELKVGDCFNGDTDATSISDVDTVDCAKPHDSEVYSVFEYPATSGDYPGPDAIGTAAEDRCRQDFLTFVGKDFDSSVLGLSRITPTAESWASANDRTIVCTLDSGTKGQKLTGSMKGANR